MKSIEEIVAAIAMPIVIKLALIGLLKLTNVFAYFLLQKWIIQNAYNWLMKRLSKDPISRAIFNHHQKKHPAKSARVCQVDGCKIVPAN